MEHLFYNSYLEVDLGVIRQNALNIQNGLKYNRTLIPAIKGNAHGYGTVQIARMLSEDVGIKTLACAQIIEGVKMREAGLNKTDILLLGAVPYHAAPYAVKYGFHIPVFNKEMVKIISDEGRRQKKIPKVQVKIEVGLHRLGVLPGEPFIELLNYIKKLGNIELAGIYSHFSNAYEKDDPITLKQYDVFSNAVRSAEREGFAPPMIHICCSGASTWVPDTISTHVRSGCMVIGFSPMNDKSNPFGVSPAASWRAFITNICSVKAGEYIGYGTSYKAEKDMKTATISVGICDGFFRPLAYSGAPLLVNGRKVKYISVCMDQAFIDVTDIPCSINDEVTIFGYDKMGNQLSTEYLSEFTDRNPTSLHGYLNDRVQRVYVNGN